MTKIKDIESKFKDKNLFLTALTHKSWLNENPGKRESNERLEYLGDAVLQFIVTNYLFKKIPDKDEGYLTLLRSNVVNTVNLAGFARLIDLSDQIFISKGEVYKADTKSILADTMEAVIGAMYLDQGLSATTKFIEKNFLTKLELIRHQKSLKDPKNILQEKMQAEGRGTPLYAMVKSIGPAHDRQFDVNVIVRGKVVGTGTGKSKAEAGTAAARQALGKYGKISDKW